MKKYLKSIGYGGTVICCLMKSSLVVMLASLGVVASFDESVYVPILFLFLTIIFVSLLHSFFIHKSTVPLAFAIGGTIAIVLFQYIFDYQIFGYMGVGFLVLSGVLDMYESKGCDSVCSFNKM